LKQTLDNSITDEIKDFVII